METIEDFIKAARILLQDTMEAQYRYSDDDYRLALELSFDEAYRIRPDMFIRNETPNYITAPMNTKVLAPRGYKMAFIYYMCGHVQLRDQEDTQDNRSSIFLNKFITQLKATAS